MYLPSSLSSQCKDLVDTYGQAIIELLVQQADPKTVCTVLALCNDARRAYVGKFTSVKCNMQDKLKHNSKQDPSGLLGLYLT